MSWKHAQGSRIGDFLLVEVRRKGADIGSYKAARNERGAVVVVVNDDLLPFVPDN
jgi:hypothetical protein